VNGVYTPDDHLLSGPIWTDLELPADRRRQGDRRLLDLRTGTLIRLSDEHAGLRSLRFVSVASSHAMALRAEARSSHIGAGAPLRPLGTPWTSDTKMTVTCTWRERADGRRDCHGRP